VTKSLECEHIDNKREMIILRASDLAGE